jgi:hypothetical protein
MSNLTLTTPPERDERRACRQACEIMFEAAERALQVPDLSDADRGRLLRIRRNLARAVGRRPLSAAHDMRDPDRSAS